MSLSKTYARDVYIVDGLRSPFLKAAGKPGPFSAADLAVAASKALLLRHPTLPMQEVVAGCVMPSPDEINIGRIIGLRVGCGIDVPGWTVQRNCASGMQALDTAAQDIATERYDIVLAGGVDAMSRAPLLFSEKMVLWLSRWYAAKTWGQRLSLITQFRPGFLAPVIALLRGLTDPTNKLSMGQTAEILAHKFNITRQDMDEFALMSQQRLAKAQDEKHFEEITPVYDTKGKAYTLDDGLRRETTLEKLAALKPYFDKKFGSVTAGNSAQITDGAAFLILASGEAVKKYHLTVLGRIVDTSWAGLEPAEMGLGPAYAIPPLLMRNHLQVEDIDYWEINEAFAAQVIACLKALADETYCKKHFALSHALGVIPLDKLNVDGGAIAIGHPVGASGARLILHLLHTLRRNHARYGVASLCIGGGQGGAMLVENTAI
ncbi:MAG: acetyl-CoA C-acetyltransferase [Gammaproteobacteria bacterium]|nr:acetyl-CoA C-acetyltransferase [Gammaproteobacteria bacterium]